MRVCGSCWWCLCHRSAPTLTHHLHALVLCQLFVVLTLRHCRLQLSVDRKPPCILSKVRSGPQVPHTRTHTHTPLLCQGARRLVQWRANFGSSGTSMSQRQPVRIACARQSDVLLLGTSHRTLHLHLEASVSLTEFSPQVLCCSLFLLPALLW